MEFPIREWNITSYEKTDLLEKNPIKSRKNFINTIILFLNFTFESENVKLENKVCVRKHGSNEKNAMHKIVLPFNFTIVWGKHFQIGSLVTEIQNFAGNVCSIFYYINLFERYGKYE